MKIEQFSAMNMVYQRYSFSYFLDSMERLGVSSFELWTGAPHLNNYIESLSDASAVRREVERRGMHITCLTPEQVMYPHNIAASDAQHRKMSLEYFLKYIDMTAQVGADKMLCCSGWGDYDAPVDEAWKRSVDSLNLLAEHAQKAGIVLAFEILQAMETNLVNDLASTERMMEEVDHPHMKLCVDTVPMRVHGNTLGQFFERFGDRICHLHLTDGDPSGHVPLGLGSTLVAEHLQYMDEYGYEGYVTLEIGDGSWWTEPERATKIAFDTVKKNL